ncbi:ABC transporter permease [Bordetella genomosp. 10]|uniref:ABC transporter permease n=1 Tax=Bordetella genomosp. 10 TaxID=1416804 RepID=A0A261SA51_9BORD|nr:ABC transporter permease [Bordetella genomosp. 10]OZI34269.1 ABC transporter permease [Bordetella genomosp. 10]
MLKFLFQRVLLALAVALTASIVTFVLLNFAVDPAAAIVGDTDDPHVIAQVRADLGLDRSVPDRYLTWLGNVLTGDLGRSYVMKQPVMEIIEQHAPVTLRLAFFGILVTMAIGIPLGTIAGLRPGTATDRAVQAVAAALQATPSFWIGLLSILLFAVRLGWLPVSGDASWRNYVLPSFILGAGAAPNVIRLTRSGMMEVMGADYIRTARAKGYRGWALLRRHALRNALLPVVSVLAIELGNKLGGSVVVEVVFAMNGLGRLALNAVLTGDIPTLQMLVLFFAVLFVLMTLLADVLNAWLDPRIRLT